MLAWFLQSIRFKSENFRTQVLPYFTKSSYTPHLLVGFTYLPVDCNTDPIFQREKPGLVSDSKSEDVSSHNHWIYQHSYDKHIRFQHRLRIHNPAFRTIYLSDFDPAEDDPK
jgi:hypothetical protein